MPLEVRANGIRPKVHKLGQLFRALKWGNLATNETMVITHIRRKLTLHTKRVSLRAAQESDLDDMFEMFKDEEVMRYWYIFQPSSVMSFSKFEMTLPRYAHQTPGRAHHIPKNPKRKSISKTCSLRPSMASSISRLFSPVPTLPALVLKSLAKLASGILPTARSDFFSIAPSGAKAS